MIPGTLTEEEFKEQCRQFVKVSDSLGDGWEIRQDGGDIYLVKNTKQAVQFRSSVENNESEKDDEDDGVSLSEPEEEDVALSADEVPPDPSLSSLVLFEYHVVYKDSYSVPVLYFLAHHVTGALLSLEEVWRVAAPSEDRYSYITQVDHPLLARPFFELHPCRTSLLMGQVLGDRQGEGRDTAGEQGLEQKDGRDTAEGKRLKDEDSRGSAPSDVGAGGGRCERTDHVTSVRPDRYLVTWLSSLGRDVGLSLSIEYGMERE